jgi:hypothetical protein
LDGSWGVVLVGKYPEHLGGENLNPATNRVIPMRCLNRPAKDIIELLGGIEEASLLREVHEGRRCAPF